MAASNTRTKLPGDEDSTPIQVLAPGAAAYLSVGAASSRVALPANAEIVQLGCDGVCWITFGDSSVTAQATTSPAFLFPGGCLALRVPSGATHVAAIQTTASSLLSISRLV